MRTTEGIIKEYKALSTPNEKYILKTYQKEDGSTFEVYEAENDDKRVELRKKYIETLPENKRLAILLHDTTCHLDHNEICSWLYEFRDDIVDQWDEFAHKEFLQKANKLLLENDFDTIKNNLINPDKNNKKQEPKKIMKIFTRKRKKLK